jgi:hypothetical protein
MNGHVDHSPVSTTTLQKTPQKIADERASRLTINERALLTYVSRNGDIRIYHLSRVHHDSAQGLISLGFVGSGGAAEVLSECNRLANEGLLSHSNLLPERSVYTLAKDGKRVLGSWHAAERQRVDALIAVYWEL